jgi:hypothetical protein
MSFDSNVFADLTEVLLELVFGRLYTGLIVRGTFGSKQVAIERPDLLREFLGRTQNCLEKLLVFLSRQLVDNLKEIPLNLGLVHNGSFVYISH